MSRAGYGGRCCRHGSNFVIKFGHPTDWRRVATRYDRCPLVFSAITSCDLHLLAIAKASLLRNAAEASLRATLLQDLDLMLTLLARRKCSARR